MWRDIQHDLLSQGNTINPSTCDTCCLLGNEISSNMTSGLRQWLAVSLSSLKHSFENISDVVACIHNDVLYTAQTNLKSLKLYLPSGHPGGYR